MAYEKLVTHYDNLKVANNAPIAVIRAAYRALVQQFHPDKFPDQALAEHRIKIINKAYEVLSDTEKRREHDAWIAEQKAMRAAAEKLHAAQAAVPPRPEVQAGGGSEARGKVPKAWRAELIGLGKVVHRLALFGGILLLTYVWAIEKPAVTLPPATIDNGRTSVKSLKPPLSKEPAWSATAVDDASRCFWVYAPIAEIGRDFPHDELFAFGQERIRWLDALLKVNKDNPEFKQVFESGVQRYKPSSIRIENSLREALVTNDRNMFASVVDAAVSCDHSLGIRTQFVPRL